LSATLDHEIIGTQRRPVRLAQADGVTITELARNLGTTVRALRYYEEAGILRPDRNRGYARRYGPEMRERAKVIVTLRRVNVPMRDIEAAMTAEEFGANTLAELLSSRLVLAQEQVREIAEILAITEI
jgi:DNA-binding transcriptional MerR regulator